MIDKSDVFDNINIEINTKIKTINIHMKISTNLNLLGADNAVRSGGVGRRTQLQEARKNRGRETRRCCFWPCNDSDSDALHWCTDAMTKWQFTEEGETKRKGKLTRHEQVESLRLDLVLAIKFKLTFNDKKPKYFIARKCEWAGHLKEGCLSSTHGWEQEWYWSSPPTSSSLRKDGLRFLSRSIGFKLTKLRLC